MERSKEFKGRKRGKLTVLQKVEDNSDKAKEKWEVYCECGTVKTILRGSFPGLRSCGCLQKAQTRLVNMRTRKKLSADLLTTEQKESYKTWVSIHQRCSKKKSHLYPNYGGRGISVCKEWDDFFTFWKDMGPKPGNDYSIERNQVNEDYCRGNCRWLLKKLQGRNTTNTVRVIYQGETYTMIDFLEQTSTLFIRKDFAFVSEERKKNGKQPVEITEHVKYLCKIIHSEPPILKPLDFN